MANLVGLNTVYFGELFSRETGMTVHNYLIQTRVLQAVNMLHSGKYKVREAAEAVGFFDVYHFSKHFKRIMGFTPSKCIPKTNGFPRQ